MTTPSVPFIEQTAGRSAAKTALRRQRRDSGAVRRPRWLTYLILAVVVLISIYPLYYTLLLASSTPA